MSPAKQSPKRRRRSKAVPVLGAAGLSLTLASGAASAATGEPVGDMRTQCAVTGHEITLREEEVADVSLATFYVVDREAAASVRSVGRLAMAACGGCGCAPCAGACAWTGSSYNSQVFGGDGEPAPVRRKYYAPRHVQKKY
jgi:hypothetical protein